jgi:hypothetical protein
MAIQYIDIGGGKAQHGVGLILLDHSKERGTGNGWISSLLISFLVLSSHWTS